MKKIFSVILMLFLLQYCSSNAQVSSYPYIETGDLPLGWNAIQGPTLWFLGNSVSNPGGVPNDRALVCNFYAQPTGVDGYIVSPVFNFTSLSKPIMHFYTAHRTHSTQNDSLYVLLSTDNGATFSVILLSRAYNSSPSLATLPPNTSEFNPSSPSQWRHETIDLSAYAGNSSITIAFRGVSDFGNNLWIDNFIIANADDYCDNTVAATGTYFCDPMFKATFSTLGNPSGGEISITQHNNQYPVPSVASVNIATNDPFTGATTQDGSRFTPNIVAPDAWFTASYTGNDRIGYANYNVQIDLSTFISVIDITKLYIMKRCDMTGSWVCLNTTSSGSSLFATGLTTFSDFAVGGDSLQNPLPVELSAFTSTITGQNVTLNWSTASELNNSGFDIERSQTIDNWSKIGFVQGKGTSSTSNSYIYNDNNLNSGKYKYRLKQIDFNGNFTYYNLGNEVIVGIPQRFELSQNYPNPFNPSTSINYQLSSADFVTIKIYDMSGKEISTLVNERKEAGFYSVSFNASALTSGVYFYKISAGNFSDTKRMMLVK